VEYSITVCLQTNEKKGKKSLLIRVGNQVKQEESFSKKEVHPLFVE
jgi:hypothetical protein